MYIPPPGIQWMGREENAYSIREPTIEGAES
jgi:hypothetical protein